MGNDYTKKQIKDWLERAVRKAKNPDLREIMKKRREQRKKKIIKNYGF